MSAYFLRWSCVQPSLSLLQILSLTDFMYSSLEKREVKKRLASFCVTEFYRGLVLLLGVVGGLVVPAVSEDYSAAFLGLGETSFLGFLSFFLFSFSLDRERDLLFLAFC